jgi:hypothetical protein
MASLISSLTTILNWPNEGPSMASHYSHHHYLGAPIPAPIKWHLYPRSIPHHSRPTPALLPSSPLASTNTKHRRLLPFITSSSSASLCLIDTTTGFTNLPSPSSAPQRCSSPSPVAPSATACSSPSPASSQPPHHHQQMIEDDLSSDPVRARFPSTRVRDFSFLAQAADFSFAFSPASSELSLPRLGFRAALAGLQICVSCDKHDCRFCLLLSVQFLVLLPIAQHGCSSSPSF